MIFVDEYGRFSSGAAAVFAMLEHSPRGSHLARAARWLPGFAAAAEFAYRVVARNRRAASWITRACVGPVLHPESHQLVRRIFLGALGVVYLAAFISAGSQASGLIGSGGILPAVELLERAELSGAGARELPTLLWLDSSDAAIAAVCGVGVLLSLALIFGIAARSCLAGLWASYLSLVSVGDVFFSYQWDALLLETGAMAILLAPGGVRPSRSMQRAVHRPALWLMRWLLFRLYFMSGAAKWLSGDPTWRNLRALDYHYFTQPIPTWTSYYFQQLPTAIQSLSTAATLVIEMGAPLLIFAPRRLRRWGAAALVALQLLILASGNYGFFNWITLALCVLLLDDEFLTRLLPARLRPARTTVRAVPWLERWVSTLLVVVVVSVTGLQLLDRLGLQPPGRSISHRALRALGPFRSLNTYGLFAVMTTQRPEIIVEGSRDGTNWKAYEFRWKPGRLDRRPRFATPHMPRLDWQMWFAALRGCDRAPWFHWFARRLLEGRSDVIALLEENPFPHDPPRLLRSTVHHYEFADLESENWWQRRDVSTFCPTFALRGGRLVRARL